MIYGAGVDVGSTQTKAVIVDGSRRIVARSLIQTGANVSRAGENAFVRACEAAGIPADRLAVDPGIGFGKTKLHNAEILGALSLYHGLGCGLMIGASRKAFVGGPEGRLPPSERRPGSLAAALAAVAQGVQIVRVHDVAQTKRALAVWAAIGAAGGGEPGIS